jgi:hypothetical protein
MLTDGGLAVVSVELKSKLTVKCTLTMNDLAARNESRDAMIRNVYGYTDGDGKVVLKFHKNLPIYISYSNTNVRF